MSNVSINLRLRPIRFAFLIRPNDRKNVLKAFRTNTCLWGGKFNPIIPFFKHLPNWWDKETYHFENSRQILNGYLDFFEPDFIVESEKEMSKDLGFDPKRVISFSNILENEDIRNREIVGQSVNEIYGYLYKKEFQFAKRHKSNIIYIKSEDTSLNAFVACVFGEFPIQKGLEYFKDNYKYIFEPREILLNGKSLTKIYKNRYTSILNIGQTDLDVRYNQYSKQDLFVLDAKKARDLIDFWNLRIVRRNILAIPIQWIEDLSPFCKEFIIKNYQRMCENPRNVIIPPTVIFSRSISDNESDKIHEKYFKVDKKGTSSIQKWYPSLWRPSPEFVVRTTRPTVNAQEKRIDMSVDLEKPAITFDNLWPKFASKYGNKNRFANAIEIRCWDDKDQFATTFPCDYRNPLFPNFRLGREHLLPTTEGIVFFPEYKNLSERWELCSGTDALNTWFKKNKIIAMLSDAGRATQQIIQTLGGFWGVGKLANSGIVELLNEMSRKPLTRSMHYAEFTNKIINAVADNGIWRYKEFETLVERNVVELGLELKCSKCGKWGWHSLGQLDYSLICDFCLKRFGFPITNPASSQYCKWAYRVIGPFSLPDYANGGYASALAIRFFANVIGRMDSVGVTWSTGQELTLSDRKIETDFILWFQKRQMFEIDYPTEIVFGEAKSFGKNVFRKKDINNLKFLAQNFPGAILVFATMKEACDLSKEEIAHLRKLAEWGRVYDKEKNQTRAPVIILTGTELFTSDSLEYSWKKKGGKHAKIISRAYVSTRLNDLQILADLTQQLYLGMESYDEWIKDKWNKKRESK